MNEKKELNTILSEAKGLGEKELSIILELLKEDFQNGDPYSVWTIIETCDHYNLSYPDWVKGELQRIAKGLNSLENPTKSYPDQIARILNMTGHVRRTAEAERRDSKISALALLAIRRGETRRETINTLGRQFHLNKRQIEKIYDKEKREFKKVENM